ncbi:hypothetical protein K490DRAFT_64660 [Saccharata proteae CBS 121410]|uniref:Uncharacterized protein n=1 Tax=Saccharata proteae CBS 121410 TaxID=1314787 RepID=A0A9P4HZB0_9PEZI|nr:hypothetical protein K490DRAFT_64660 [Saccharata proteae CBS 121410]
MSEENKKPNRRDSKAELVNHEDGVMPTVENVIGRLATATGLKASRTQPCDDEQSPTESSTAGMARTATHKVADAASNAAGAVVETVKDVSSAVVESTSKASKKVEEDADDSLGPYYSPATCAMSDMDPLAGFVHSGGDLTSDEPLRERNRRDEPSDRK